MKSVSKEIKVIDLIARMLDKNKIVNEFIIYLGENKEVEVPFKITIHKIKVRSKNE